MTQHEIIVTVLLFIITIALTIFITGWFTPVIFIIVIWTSYDRYKTRGKHEKTK